MVQQVKNRASFHEDADLIPGLAQWVRNLAFLWLWCWLAVAAPIGPLAWEPPYASGLALKRQNKQTKKFSYNF